jgi:hypothetical protein
LAWLRALKEASSHEPDPYVKGRSRAIIRFGSGSTTTIGKTIVLGQASGLNVELKCIAGWGNTLSENGKIVRNPKPQEVSANNYTLAFILSFGEFRYFIGGDMGGVNGTYIDQETTVTKYLNDTYPSSVSTVDGTEGKGHLCGFKANHHGSDKSNNASFMENMRPAIIFTSAGSNKGWHLPSVGYLTRLSNVNPLSENSNLTDGNFNKGVYFTNLYDFTKGASKTKAISLFRNKPGVSFDFGNDTPTSKGSYIVKVKGSASLTNTSQFEVGRVELSGTTQYKKLALFKCHTK